MLMAQLRFQAAQPLIDLLKGFLSHNARVLCQRLPLLLLQHWHSVLLLSVMLVYLLADLPRSRHLPAMAHGLTLYQPRKSEMPLGTETLACLPEAERLTLARGF